MSKKLKISIRTKILTMLSLVVMGGVGLYLYLASRIFYEDKTLLIYELNQNQVRTLGGEIDTKLKRILDQMKLGSSLEMGKYFLALSFCEDAQTPCRILKQNIKDSDFLTDLRARFPLPWEKLKTQAVWIRNTTFLSTSLSAQNPEELQATFCLATRTPEGVLVADLRLDDLLDSFPRSGIAQAYLTDSEGELLAHSDQKKILERKPVLDPLLGAAMNSKVRSEIRKFQEADISYLGSFYKLDTAGLILASKTELSEAFSAMRMLLKKTLLYALVVITLAFIVALFFAHTLTTPIERMVAATGQIAGGQFNLQVPISTRDELALLADSFNTMTLELKNSREKIEAAHAQLIKSEKMAALGQVARAIGHEFGNILQAILGKAELALQEPEPARVREKLNLIIKATDRASLIIRNLRSFAKSSPTRIPSGFPQIILDTLSLVNHELKKNNIQVVQNFKQDTPILINPSEIEQVFLNLIINAIHAMPQGGTLEMGCDATEGSVHAWVCDSGTGIPSEILPHIFEYAYTTKGEQGSGLGLAISKQIIAAHQGSLEVETVLGNGSMFTIRLPGMKTDGTNQSSS